MAFFDIDGSKLGPEVRVQIEGFLAQLGDDYLGPAAPSDPFLFMKWGDNSGTNTIAAKVYDGTGWVLLWTLDTSTNAVTYPLPNATTTVKGIIEKATQTEARDGGANVYSDALTAKKFLEEETHTYTKGNLMSDSDIDIGDTGTSTITPLIANGNVQTMRITGDFTLNAPTDVGVSYLDIEVTNDATGGRTVTFAGLTKGGGSYDDGANVVQVFRISKLASKTYIQFMQGEA